MANYLSRTLRALFGAGVAIGLCSISAAKAVSSAAPSYKLTNTVPLGPGERWDFVVFDPNSDRVYIAHGDHLTIVDQKQARVIRQMRTFPGGTHGIARSAADQRGYTDDGKAGLPLACPTACNKSSEPPIHLSGHTDKKALSLDVFLSQSFENRASWGDSTAISITHAGMWIAMR